MIRRGIIRGVAAKATTEVHKVTLRTDASVTLLFHQARRETLLNHSVVRREFHRIIGSGNISSLPHCASNESYHCCQQADYQRRSKSTITSSTPSSTSTDKAKDGSSTASTKTLTSGTVETSTAQGTKGTIQEQIAGGLHDKIRENTGSGGLYRLLTEQEREMLVEQRELTQMARTLATDILTTHAAEHSTAATSNNNIIDPFPSTSLLSDLQLDSTFAIVVAGEFNAGKSTLINALLGKKILESGAIPTTDSITILAGASSNNGDGNGNIGQQTEAQTAEASESHNDAASANRSVSTSTIPILPETTAESTQRDQTTAPHPPLGVVLHRIPDQPMLDDLTIIDTPGTNAPEWMDHTHRTLKLLPAADLILFVTSADRPMTQSEQTLMEQIQTLYKKPILVVVNKMDILNAAGGDHGAKHRQQVLDFVVQNASNVNSGGSNSGGLVLQQALVIPVSAKDALSAKLMAGSGSGSDSSSDEDESIVRLNQHTLSNVWKRSNFDTLEGYLKENLTSRTRIKSKLANPLGVVDGVMEQCLEKLKEQNKEIQDDILTLNLVRRQWDTWKEQLDAELKLFQHDMNELLDHESQRVHTFISSKSSDAASTTSYHSNRINRSLYDLYYWTLLPSNYPTRLLQEWDATNHPIMFGHSRRSNDVSTGGDSIAASRRRNRSGSSGTNSLEAELLALVEETADAIATRGRAQGQSVIEYLGTRPAQKHQSLVGSVSAASRFEDTRQVLTDSWSEAVQSILGGADFSSGHMSRNDAGGMPKDSGTSTISQPEHRRPQASQNLRREDMRVLESLRQTAMLASAFHAGSMAVGLALAAPMIASTTAIVDPIYASLVLTTSLGMGSLIHAQGTSRVAKRHEDEWKRRTSRLEEAISVIGRRELDRVERRILQGVAPYSRFVENEQQRIQQATESCERVLVASRQLRNRIQKI